MEHKLEDVNHLEQDGMVTSARSSGARAVCQESLKRMTEHRNSDQKTARAADVCIFQPNS